jgi:hypothetical protein
MTLPRRYVVADDEPTSKTLAEIVKRGRSQAFWAVYGDLQFSPRASGLGARRFIDSPDTYLISLGQAAEYLVYRVHEDPPLIALLGLADIL